MLAFFALSSHIYMLNYNVFLQNREIKFVTARLPCFQTSSVENKPVGAGMGSY